MRQKGIIYVLIALLLCACNSKAEEIPNTNESNNVPIEITTEYAIKTVTNIKNVTPQKKEEDIVKRLGVGINLGNTFEAFWEDSGNRTTGAQRIGQNSPMNYETCWGSPYTTFEMIEGMKKAGFSTVRIPVYWGNMMENDGKFQLNQEYVNRVKEVVNYCIENDMYAVINIHHFDEFLVKNYAKEDVLRIVGILWNQIAQQFAGYGEKLLFEGFNENLGTVRSGDSYSEDEVYEYVNAMNQTFVDAVRKTEGNNKNRWLIVSGYWTNIDKTTDERFKMPTDCVENHLMISVHYVDNAMYWSNQVGTKEWLEYAKNQCELLKERFKNQDIPVFIGECNGIYESEHLAANADFSKDCDCFEKMISMILDYGFIPVIWDDSNRFFERNQCKILDKGKAELLDKFTRN